MCINREHSTCAHAVKSRLRGDTSIVKSWLWQLAGRMRRGLRHGITVLLNVTYRMVPYQPPYLPLTPVSHSA